MEFKRAFYTANVRSEGCIYDVRINDCPAIANEKGYSGNNTVPINQWLYTGENTLQIHISGNNGRCSAEVLAQQENGNVAELVVAHTIAAVESKPFMEEIRFEVLTPFPLWRWSQMPSLAIEEFATEHEGILKVARTYWETLAAKDLSKLKHMSQIKLGETSIAWHQPREVREEAFDLQFNDLFFGGNWHLGKFDIEDIEYKFYGNNRLVKLMDSQTRESPIYFVDGDEQLASYLELILYKEESGNWWIAR